jgi:hypothetical protein
LTTDGSGLGVGVPSSGRSGFAAATHRNPSLGGLACRPDNGVVVLRRGDGLQLHRPAAQQCNSLSPFSSSSRTAGQWLQHGVPPVQRPSLQAERRHGGPAAQRPRAPPQMAPPSDSSSSLPPPFMIPARRWMDWGRTSHGGADQGRIGWGCYL